ncbi:hypothetical protein TSUD_298650 [Trifolium subterraneum]|nr:hypothetical protein TSUD_298650 [Trifolium subterraneum]
MQSSIFTKVENEIRIEIEEHCGFQWRKIRRFGQNRNSAQKNPDSALTSQKIVTELQIEISIFYYI